MNQTCGFWAEEWPEEWQEEWQEEWPEEWQEEWPEEWQEEWPEEWWVAWASNRLNSGESDRRPRCVAFGWLVGWLVFCGSRFAFMLNLGMIEHTKLLTKKKWGL